MNKKLVLIAVVVGLLILASASVYILKANSVDDIQTADGRSAAYEKCPNEAAAYTQALAAYQRCVAIKGEYGCDKSQVTSALQALNACMGKPSNR